jgi:hypothetical protein
MKNRGPYLNLFYIFSLAVLACLIILSVLHPFQGTRQTDTIQKMQLLRSNDAWIIQLQLVNRQPEDVSYHVQTMIGQHTYHGYVTIKKDGVYIYNQPVEIAPAFAGKTLQVLVNIYENEGTAPVESMTYFLPGVQS